MAKPTQDPWTNDEARRVLDDCARSGLSVGAFARQHGQRSRRLYRWRSRLGLPKLTRGRRPALPRFAPVIALPAPRASGLTLRVGEDVALRFDDAASVEPSWMAALLREMRGCWLFTDSCGARIGPDAADLPV